MKKAIELESSLGKHSLIELKGLYRYLTYSPNDPAKALRLNLHYMERDVDAYIKGGEGYDRILAVIIFRLRASLTLILGPVNINHLGYPADKHAAATTEAEKLLGKGPVSIKNWQALATGIANIPGNGESVIFAILHRLDREFPDYSKYLDQYEKRLLINNLSEYLTTKPPCKLSRFITGRKFWEISVRPSAIFFSEYVTDLEDSSRDRRYLRKA
tara:strand:- start:187 stop:831 length:645 start_codon:yes stop_codon:yes gene_type:complete